MSYGHQDCHVGRLQSFAQRLEGLSTMDDLSVIRRRLAESARDLLDCVPEISATREAAIWELRQVEEVATKDVVTGISDRRRASEQAARSWP